jgi:hypothetical protein
LGSGEGGISLEQPMTCGISQFADVIISLKAKGYICETADYSDMIEPLP